jgi:hypothetical protein
LIASSYICSFSLYVPLPFTLFPFYY